jgi:hypothetical protein
LTGVSAIPFFRHSIIGESRSRKELLQNIDWGICNSFLPPFNNWRRCDGLLKKSKSQEAGRSCCRTLTGVSAIPFFRHSIIGESRSRKELLQNIDWGICNSFLPPFNNWRLIYVKQPAAK